MNKTKGRLRCEVLKDIRRSVAEQFGIAYNSKPCTYEGECSGTCPACQRETDHLWQEVKAFCQAHPDMGKALQQQMAKEFEDQLREAICDEPATTENMAVGDVELMQ